MNLFILYLGAFVRYVFLWMFKSKKEFGTILHGIPEKSKADKMLNLDNEFVNRLFGIVTLIIVILIIVSINKS